MDSLQSMLGGSGRSAPPPEIAEGAQPGIQGEAAAGDGAVREQRPAGSPDAPAPQQSAEAAPRGQTSGDGPVRLQQPAGSQQQAQAQGTQAQTQVQAQAEAPGSGDSDAPRDIDEADAGANSDAPRDLTAEEEAEADPDVRVAEGPSAEGVGGNMTRRFNSLFGSGTGITQPDDLVETEDVAGTWTMEEEDGLRTCTVTLASAGGGKVVQPASGCSGLATRATRWSIFGSDLLLSSSDNTVVARLRRSGESWIGFTLESGIPVVLSRSATGQG